MEAATALVEKAIDLNPNSAMAFRLGAVLHGYLGQAEKAVDYAERGDRLNPLDSGWNREYGIRDRLLWYWGTRKGAGLDGSNTS